MKNNRPQLLTPVGSFECLIYAIRGGTDALYFCVEQLNMLTKSTPSITAADIKYAVKQCHASNVKAHITLHTTKYDHNKHNVKLIVEKSNKAGVDAIIACDSAEIMECVKNGIPVHISTHTNVTNSEKVADSCPVKIIKVEE